MLVGDQSRVYLSAQHDPTLSRISWPAIPDSFGKLEVVQKDKIDTVKNGRFVTYRQLLLVSAFDSGLYQIPRLQINVAPVSGTPYTLQTEPKEFVVQTVPVDTTKPFKPIKGILAVESSWLDYIWWIIAGAIALLALGLVLYFSTQKKHKIPPPPPAVEPLHIRALAMLQALEAESLWQKGEIKEYYVRLTDILRSYIEARYAVPAMERTTDELTAAARRHGELSLQADRLYHVLATADMAKFARAQPVAAEHVAAMQAAKDLITAGIPVPQPVVSQTPVTPQPDKS